MIDTILSVLQVFLSVGVIFLVLLHSGKDAGMSGAFGVGVAGGSSGGSLMERNLDRWTIVFAILFGGQHDRDPQDSRRSSGSPRWRNLGVSRTGFASCAR